MAGASKRRGSRPCHSGRIGDERPEDGRGAAAATVRVQPFGADGRGWIEHDGGGEAGFEGRDESAQERRGHVAQRQEVDGGQA